MHSETNIEELWSIFKNGIRTSVEKHILKKQGQIIQTSQEDLYSWSRFRQYQKECKRELRMAEWDNVNKIIQEGMDKHNTKPFWNYIKSKKQDNIGVAPLKKKGNLLSDAKGKVEILIEQFQSVFTKSNVTASPELLNRNSYPNNCANELSTGLSMIFQHSLNSGELPLDWRKANITPVFKKGDKHTAENYRPVSLTSVTCKILELIICSHLLNHFEKHN
ncbi:hypothetical protein MAR_035857, partial [Mya arenaria]